MTRVAGKTVSAVTPHEPASFPPQVSAPSTLPELTHTIPQPAPTTVTTAFHHPPRPYTPPRVPRPEGGPPHTDADPQCVLPDLRIRSRVPGCRLILEDDTES